MSDEKKNFLNENELNSVNGGSSSSGTRVFRVGDCNGGFLALKEEPNAYSTELAQLWPGYTVTSDGQVISGPGPKHNMLNYAHVCYNGIWGYANKAHLY